MHTCIALQWSCLGMPFPEAWDLGLLLPSAPAKGQPMRRSFATAQPSLGVQHSSAGALLILLPGVAGLGSMRGPKGAGQQANAAVCLPPQETSSAPIPQVWPAREAVAEQGGASSPGAGTRTQSRSRMTSSPGSASELHAATALALKPCWCPPAMLHTHNGAEWCRLQYLLRMLWAAHCFLTVRAAMWVPAACFQ